MLVCAACAIARICLCATHAAWPFLPCSHHIAFALCLLVQLALLFALVYVPCMCSLAPLALSAALHLRYACLCIICFCSHQCMCDACGWALLALSASYCIRAMPAYASCSAVCISICAVHERLGASRPVCSIAFALCLWVQHVSLLALVYVPRMRLGPSCLVRSYCFCALLACAACSAVCINIRAVHMQSRDMSPGA